MLTEILHNVKAFRGRIADLNKVAPDYPKIYFEDSDGCLWASTMVTFENKGTKYRRHHVESVIPTDTIGINELQAKLVDAAETTIKYGIPYEFDEVIKNK